MLYKNRLLYCFRYFTKFRGSHTPTVSQVKRGGKQRILKWWTHFSNWTWRQSRQTMFTLTYTHSITSKLQKVHWCKKDYFFKIFTADVTQTAVFWVLWVHPPEPYSVTLDTYAVSVSETLKKKTNPSRCTKPKRHVKSFWIKDVTLQYNINPRHQTYVWSLK